MNVHSPYASLLEKIPVTKDEVVVLGSTTRYWTYGDPDAPVTVVLAHGYRGEHHGLEPVIAQLPSVRFISPDLPGFGESTPLTETAHDIDGYAQWLIAFVEALGLTGRAVALGHSFGSIITSAALKRGLQAQALILVNPIAISGLKGPRPVSTFLTVMFYRTAGMLPERLANSLLRSPLIVQFMSSALVKTRDKGLRKWIHNEHHTYFSNFATRRSVIEGFEASIAHSVGDFVESIELPTLLVAAELDDITPLSANRALAASIPNSKLVVLPGVGHLIHYESPVPAAEAISEFLGSLDLP
ncbi:pimeloyl-ACP methyl ester carboxylesterase [Homoserinimonas aerilata]|uniref:Pimeloyl-ACP methyl ester carboxylesterase n=1 Tax=Homoserinimonas aerilata TaxID=1162970 RepID=A0A542YJB1_9MICO|nr:alpha/beta hydrolase [Homoserinimonas aerilata]TQL48054.1 pimeloyl-ACP methyl ester carboxylesterase [Homoserinimonas aerilata]